MIEEYGHIPDAFLLNPEETEELRTNKRYLTAYATQKLRKLKMNNIAQKCVSAARNVAEGSPTLGKLIREGRDPIQAKVFYEYGAVLRTLAEELGNSIAEPVAYGMESMLGVGSNTRKGPLSNVVSWMPNFFITLIAGMQAWAPKFESTLTEIFTKAMQGAINITSSAVSRIMDMIASASKALSSLNSSKISTSNINAPNIPRMAEGGIVTSPTLAMIGENGPEAVVPLGKGGGMGSDVYVTNHITVSPKADKEEMKKMFSTFAREQGRELRRRTSYMGGVYA